MVKKDIGTRVPETFLDSFYGYTQSNHVTRSPITVIAGSSRMQAVPHPHVGLDQRAGRVGIMGPFLISVKFLAWGLCPPGEGSHRPTPREPEKGYVPPMSGQLSNRPLRSR